MFGWLRKAIGICVAAVEVYTHKRTCTQARARTHTYTHTHTRTHTHTHSHTLTHTHTLIYIPTHTQTVREAGVPSDEMPQDLQNGLLDTLVNVCMYGVYRHRHRHRHRHRYRLGFTERTARYLGKCMYVWCI